MSFPQVLTGVAHIGIPTNDLDKTIAFYKKLAVFIGGTKGGMEAVLDEVLGKNPNARICISAIALETLGAAIAALTARGLTAEVTQIAVSRTKPAGRLHLLMANNPIFLITGTRK